MSPAPTRFILVKGSGMQAEAVVAELPDLLAPMGLCLSGAKTGLTHIDQGSTFLGFRIVRRSRGKRKPCVYTFVSNEAFASVKAKVKALTRKSYRNLSLHQLLRAINPILRGWTTNFRFAAAKRTLAYLAHCVWWRVARWLCKKHPKLTWKQLKRRYGLPKPPEEAGVVLFNPAAVRVLRYRYRGAQIATAWNAVEKKRCAHRVMAFDEPAFIGGMEESLCR